MGDIIRFAHRLSRAHATFTRDELAVLRADRERRRQESEAEDRLFPRTRTDVTPLGSNVVPLKGEKP